VVCAAEPGNEILDRLHYGSWRWADTDVVNTLFWPTMLFIGLKLRQPRVDPCAPKKTGDD
jgi:hypothetical protein